MNLAQIKNRFHISFQKPRQRMHRLSRPARDWLLLLGSFLLFTLLLAVLSGYLFVQVQSGELYVTERADSEGMATINRSQLEEAISILNQKEAASRARPPLPDPSR